MSYFDSGTVGRYRARFARAHEGHVWNDYNDEHFLESIGACSMCGDGSLHPTVAGLVMFGQDRWITKELPEYFLDYRQELRPENRWQDRFTSITGDWSGNVYDFYIRVYNAMKQALKVPFRLEDGYRVDDTPAHEALREALINCITNANYFERCGIVCQWTEDALIVSNPGDFRMPVDEARRPGASDPRNAVLLKMFSLIEAGERAGSGMSKIFSGWMSAGYGEPTYEVRYDPDRTVMTLPLYREPDDPKVWGANREMLHGCEPLDEPLEQRSEPLDEPLESGDTSLDQDILRCMRADATVTYDDLASRLGASRSTIRRHIEALSESGKVRRTGGKRYGAWEALGGNAE